MHVLIKSIMQVMKALIRAQMGYPLTLNYLKINE